VFSSLICPLGIQGFWVATCRGYPRSSESMSIVYGLSGVGFATFGCMTIKITNTFVEKSALWARFDISAGL